MQSTGKSGLVVLIDSHLKGGAKKIAAVVNTGGVFLRKVEVEGYVQGVSNTPSVAQPGANPGARPERSSNTARRRSSPPRAFRITKPRRWGWKSGRPHSSSITILETGTASGKRPTPRHPTGRSGQRNSGGDRRGGQGRQDHLLFPARTVFDQPAPCFSRLPAARVGFGNHPARKPAVHLWTLRTASR